MSFTEKFFIHSDGYTSANSDGYTFATGTYSQGTDGYLLLGMLCTNQTNSTLFAQVFDGYTAPTLNQVPVLELQVPSNGQSSLDLGSAHCEFFKKGITVAASSTSGKFTYLGAFMFNRVWFIRH